MFILASASPRREELLRQIGCVFSVVPSLATEIADLTLAPTELALANAKLKARQVAKDNPDVPILGADTVVFWDGRIYGKPHNADDAKFMLTQLSGRIHRVVTGLALVNNKRLYSVAATTEVRFAPLSEADIDAYVATGEPLDKAGAYAVQGKAATFIEGINGSYSNVVGLPLYAFTRLAKKAGVTIYE